MSKTKILIASAFVGLLLLAVGAKSTGLASLIAQTNSTTCGYNITPLNPTITLTTNGSIGTASVTFSGTSTSCSTDAVSIQVWDSASQSEYPYCWTVPSSVNNGNGTVTINCNVPSSIDVTPASLLIRARNQTTNAITNSVPLTLNLPVPVCTSLTLNLNDNKTTYSKGDMVNYTYSCAQTGVKAATVNVVLYKPDGTNVIYNTGTNINTASLGFSTSNLNAGNYILKACSDTTCTGGFFSQVNFTIADTTTITYPPAITNGVGGATCKRTDGTTYTPGSTYWCESGHDVTCPSDGTMTSTTLNGNVFKGCYRTSSGTGTGTGTTGGTTTGTAKSCANGERCASGSWCSGGQMFYYPNSEITCVAWSTNGGNVTAPAGTSSCKPDDKNCITSGEYGPSTGWCSNGMKFNQKIKDADPNNDIYCAPNNYTGTAGTTWVQPTPPAGYGACSLTDTNCKEAGDKWTDNNSSYYCSSAQKCTNANGGGSCVGWNETCPSGTKYCNATDTNCVEPGNKKSKSSGSSTNNYYWCGGGGMDFHSSNEVYCPPKTSGNTTMGMMTGAEIKAILDQLGSGWGLCEAFSNSGGKCLEPGQTGASSDWCAWWPPNTSGSAMNMTTGGGTKTCPSLDGTTATEPTPTPKPEPTKNWVKYSWTFNDGTTESSYVLDRTDKEYTDYLNSIATQCKLIPRTKFSWKTDAGNDSASNWKNFGIPNCQGNNIQPEPIKSPICPTVMPITSCPKGKVLKNGMTEGGCGTTWCEDIKEGPNPPGPYPFPEPMPLPGPMACKDQIRMFRDEVRGHRFFLRDFERQLREATTETEEIKEIKALLEKAKNLAFEAETALKTASCDGLEKIRPKVEELRTELIPDLNLMQDSIRVFGECKFFQRDIERRVKEIDRMSRESGNKKVTEELNGKKKAFSDLYEQSKKVCAAGDSFALEDLRFEWQDLEENMRDIFERMHDERANSYLENAVGEFGRLLTEAQKKPLENEELKTMLSRAGEILDNAKNAIEDGEYMEAGQAIDQLQKMRDPIITLLKKEGVEITIDIRVEDALRGSISEAALNKLADAIAQKFADKIGALVEEKTQQALAKLAEVKFISQEKVAEMSQSIANLQAITEERRNEIMDLKNQLLTQAQEIESRVAKTKLQAQAKKDLNQGLEIAMRTNWCGTKGEEIKSQTEAMMRAVEAGDIGADDTAQFLAKVNVEAVENPKTCYEVGTSPFKDTPTEEWYFTAAKFNSDNGFMSGSKDASGKLTGDFMPAQPTLWGEAVTMAMRMFNVKTGNTTTLNAPISGVADWMIPYVNGALEHGIPLARFNRPMNETISRVEVAELMAEFMQRAGVNLSTTTGTSLEYKDYGRFGRNENAAHAVETMAERGIMKGSNGYFRPDDRLLRSEFATINQRLVENLDLAQN